MPEPRTSAYHHGDLRTACLRAAMDLLDEAGEEALTLRAVARRAGVSANAPYRHFRDKDALLSAVATLGFHELYTGMSGAEAAAAQGEEFIALGQSYVRFGRERPGLFQLMFSHPCSRSDPETSAAAAQVTALLDARVSRLVPDPGQQSAFAIGTWSLVHGLTSLLINGKLTTGSPEQTDELVRDVVVTSLTSSPLASGPSASPPMTQAAPERDTSAAATSR